jgi:hypothetical protein
MEGEKKWLVEKLIGLKFSMEDWKTIAAKAQDSMVVAKQELKAIVQHKYIFEEKVCYIFILIWCFVLRWVPLIPKTCRSISLVITYLSISPCCWCYLNVDK